MLISSTTKSVSQLSQSALARKRQRKGNASDFSQLEWIGTSKKASFEIVDADFEEIISSDGDSLEARFLPPAWMALKGRHLNYYL